MENFTRPSIVIASTTNLILPENIVKDILELQELPLPVTIVGVDEAAGYPWHIETKYYTADVNICTLNTKTIGTKVFAESVNALILCFDSNSENAISDIEQWFTYTKEFDPEIKILICNCCAENASSNSVSKVEAQKWCIKHGFELVELNPEEDPQDPDVEDDFTESLGIKRVVQALQAHTWPNLALKDSTVNRMVEVTDSMGEDAFEELFQKMNEMKVKAESLSPTQRKVYAEKMAIDFWRSMGGNESEIDGLSSEDDSEERSQAQ